MTTKKRGRKPSGHGKEYKKGYQCEFQRVRRELLLGMEPRKIDDKKRSKDYQNGQRDGRKAAKKTYKKK